MKRQELCNPKRDRESGNIGVLEDDQVMGPADLCNQGLHFWQVAVCEVKFPHVEYISAGIAANAGKLLSQVCGKLLGDSSAMSGVYKFISSRSKY